jgi:uncharacterized protein with HEPN domain
VTSRGDADRLSHIEEAIDRILSYAAELSSAPGPPGGVVGDALNDAVLYNLAVIGEAVKALSPLCASAMPTTSGASSRACVTS